MKPGVSGFSGGAEKKRRTRLPTGSLENKFTVKLSGLTHRSYRLAEERLGDHEKERAQQLPFVISRRYKVRDFSDTGIITRAREIISQRKKAYIFLDINI